MRDKSQQANDLTMKSKVGYLPILLSGAQDVEDMSCKW
jgi:hypothetical protein